MEFSNALSNIFEGDLWMLLLAVLLIGCALGIIVAWLIWGGKVRKLQDKISNLQSDMTRQQATLNDYREQLDMQEGDLKRANLEVEELKSQLEAAEVDSATYATDLSVANDQVEQLRATNKANADTIEDLQNQILGLKAKNNQLANESQLNEQDLEGMAEMQSTYNATLERLKSLESKIATLVNDNDELRSSITRMNTNKKAAAADKTPTQLAASLGPQPVQNDFTVIEGIGPKIADHLKRAGIHTWQDLAEATREELQTILDLAGPHYRMHDPTTWPQQAAFAAAGKWERLKEYQDFLSGGRDMSH